MKMRILANPLLRDDDSLLHPALAQIVDFVSRMRSEEEGETQETASSLSQRFYSHQRESFLFSSPPKVVASRRRILL
jgi:hypothetical protein